jgi:2-methylaconitate cis-trans-isomerase PrpF
MTGFQAVIDGELHIGVQSCAGEVTFDNLQARAPDALFPTTPGIDIVDSASVTLRDVVDFGIPAVRVTNSRVLLCGYRPLQLSGWSCRSCRSGRTGRGSCCR